MNIDNIMRELAEYIWMAEQITDTLTGTEHKATCKAVTSSRLDTTALKRELPEIAARYSKSSETKRFTFC